MPVSRPALFFAILLLVIGAWRIGSLVAHDPVLGYGNQFDAGRTSACVGMWPDLPGDARYQPHREAPVGAYADGPRRLAECYPSTEVVLAATSIAAWRGAVLAKLADGRAMDARWLGSIGGGALVLLAILFTIGLREHPLWMIAHAAAFALVLADPLVTLWLNTLYTEFAAVLCAYAAVGCLVIACGIRPDRARWWFGLALALSGVAMSRQQHAFLPLFFALLALTVGWRYRRGWAVAVLVVAIVAAIVQAAVITRAATIGAANRVDVVLGTLLPAAPNQYRALASLPLPDRCAGVIGATWYVTMGEDLSEHCPEASTVSRLRILELIASEPSIVVRVLARAAPLTRTMLLRYVGMRDGARFGSIEDEPSLAFSWQGLRSLGLRSFAPLLERLPLYVHVGWQIFLFTLLPLALIVWFVRSARGAGSVGPLVASALSGTYCYALLTSVLGDGYVEMTRHAHLGVTAALALLVIFAVALLFGLFTREGPRIVAGAPVGQPTSLEFKLSVAAVALAVAMTSVLWWPGYRKLPLAMGAVDEPESNRIASPRVVLHGWTLGPLGATQAYAMVNDATRIEARGWQHPTDPVGVELARVFPFYLDPATARFEIALDLSSFRGNPVRVRTYAVDANDVPTEIDRRVLVPRPR